MDIDLDLYRHEVRVSTHPLVHGAAGATSLVKFEYPQWTFVFMHGFGGQAAQWKYEKGLNFRSK
jgi:hypothetical protein